MPNASQDDVNEAGRILFEQIDKLRETVGKEIDETPIKTAVGEIQKRLSENRQFQAAVSVLDSLSGSVGTAAQAYYAGQKGDAIGASSYSLAAVAAVTKGVAVALMTAGPEALPFAAVVAVMAAIIDIVASILGLFRSKEEALINQIAGLLIHERSKDLQGKLISASNELNDWEELLNVRPFKAASWTELSNQYHLRAGKAVTFCNEAVVWLLNAEHQDQPESWVDVFEAYASCVRLQGMVYFSQWASWVDYALSILKAGASDAEKARLEAIDEQAWTEMRQHFEKATNTFRDLHWLGRRMAPIWMQSRHDQIVKASVGFVDKRTENTKWKEINRVAMDQFAVLPRNEGAEGGGVLWFWRNNITAPPSPFYLADSSRGLQEFQGFGAGFQFVSMDVAFLGDSEPPKRANPNATPQPWTGVDVLLALENHTNKLHLRYFAPEKGLDYKDLPKNEQNKFDLPSTISTPQEVGAIGPIRQVRVRVLRDRSKAHTQTYSVHAYLLGKDKTNTKDQVYRVTSQNGTPTPYGVSFDTPVVQIYVNDAAVWALSGDYEDTSRSKVHGRYIWYRAHDAADSAPWTRIDNLRDAPGMGGDWDIFDIHPGDDGLLIASVVYRLYGYTREDGWQQSKADVAEVGMNSGRMVRLPLDGFRMFNAAWESAQAWKELAAITKASFLPKAA
jgi:hypothetical protein